MRFGWLAVFLLGICKVVLAQEVPASPVPMTLGLIDSDSDQKQTTITVRYDSKPGFSKPKIEAHSSFVQVILPMTIVPKPGSFFEIKRS